MRQGYFNVKLFQFNSLFLRSSALQTLIHVIFPLSFKSMDDPGINSTQEREVF